MKKSQAQKPDPKKSQPTSDTPKPRKKTGFQPGHKVYPRKKAKNTTIKVLQWAEIEKLITTEGASKAFAYLGKLRGSSYIRCYVSLLRYFKPVFGTITIEGNAPPPAITINHTVLTAEESKEVVNAEVNGRVDS